MPRQNLTSRKLKRKLISSNAPSRDGHFAYDPELQRIIVSQDDRWVLYDDMTPPDPPPPTTITTIYSATVINENTTIQGGT